MDTLDSSLYLSNDDIYLLGNGNWFRSYEKLGAHPAKAADGTSGYHFAVWAPHVQSVHVIGDFNDWDEVASPLTKSETGDVWEGFIPGVVAGQLYKFLLVSHDGEKLYKADPYAFFAELPPGTASRTADISGYAWKDEKWMAERAERPMLKSPLNIFEVHLGSWKRHGNEPQGEPREDGTWPGPGDPFPAQRGTFYTYDDLSKELVAYVKKMGYSHIEVLPLSEHPFDGSWGYQPTGYFAPTSRFGNPQQLMHFVDACHKAGIGVIMDWVPGGFCADAHGLATFNGEMLYEHEIHPNWGTHKFDFARGQVRSFLVSNALYWVETFHIDGIRMDGVSSMLYMNFGIDDPGQKRFNKLGTEEDLDASAFIRQTNTTMGQLHPLAARDLPARGRRPGLPLQVGHGLDERHPALHADRLPVAPGQPPHAHVLHDVPVQRELRAAAFPRRGRQRQVLAHHPHAGRPVAPVRRPARARLLPDDPRRRQAQFHGQRDRPVH